MPKTDVIRAWKDAEYRESLSSSALAALPENPAGPMELRDDELDLAAGGETTVDPYCTLDCSFGPACSSCCRCPDTQTSWNSSCCSL